MNPRRALRSVGAAVLWCAAAPLASAHHGPEHAIERLTERLREQPTAELWVRRGDALRIAGRPAEAAADYRAALAALPGEGASRERAAPVADAARHGLALAHFHGGDGPAALAAAREAACAAADPDQAAPHHALASRILRQQGDLTGAREAHRAALRSSRWEIDWVLEAADLLQELQRDEEARDLLREAVRRQPSEVLHRAWIAALVRSGETSAAEPAIAAGLATARHKHAWLLLRARLRLAQGRPAEAADDAAAALAGLQLLAARGPAPPTLQTAAAAARSLRDEARAASSP